MCRCVCVHCRLHNVSRHTHSHRQAGTHTHDYAQSQTFRLQMNNYHRCKELIWPSRRKRFESISAQIYRVKVAKVAEELVLSMAHDALSNYGHKYNSSHRKSFHTILLHDEFFQILYFDERRRDLGDLVVAAMNITWMRQR